MTRVPVQTPMPSLYLFQAGTPFPFLLLRNKPTFSFARCTFAFCLFSHHRNFVITALTKCRCKDVMKDSIDILCPEHHHLCRGCIIAHASSTSIGECTKCPSCRGKIPYGERNIHNQHGWDARVCETIFEEVDINKFVQRLIRGLETKCTNSEEGKDESCDFAGDHIFFLFLSLCLSLSLSLSLSKTGARLLSHP